MPEIHSSKQQGVAMLTLVLLLLVIASMAASGYLFYLRQQDSQSLELKLNTFSASVDEKLKSTAAAQKAIVQLEKNIDVADLMEEYFVFRLGEMLLNREIKMCKTCGEDV